MTKCKHCNKPVQVHETRTRSIVKSVTSWAAEVLIDTFLLSMLTQGKLEIALSLSILVEIICLGTGYGWERLWNRINWGREVRKK